MKKKLFTSKVKTLLIVAVALAIITTVVVAIAGSTTVSENVVGTVLQPLRSGVAAIDRQALRLYNYIFSYESLQAENAALKAEEDALRADALAYAQFCERIGTMECEARKRAEDMEAATLSQLQQTVNLFRSQYHTLMNTFEIAAISAVLPR